MRNSPRNKRKNCNQNLARRFEKLEDRLLLAGDMEFRSFDGSGNNLNNEDWGAANQQLLRLTTVEYGSGSAVAFPALATRVDSNGDTINPRTVSNLLFDQDVSKLNDRGLTSFTFQWGQFLDHDMDLTEDFAPVGVADRPDEDISFLVPTDGTESELPLGTIIPQLRSRFELDEHGIAQQINQITSYIDQIRVDARVAELFAGSVEVHGGGKFDRLVVEAADQIVVVPTEIRVNDLSVFYGNIEKVEVRARGGGDLASVAGLFNVNPALASGLGNDVLVAAAGTDLLSRGGGRDLGVGGRHVLFGNSADDTSLTGETSADLVAVQRAGRSDSSYSSRVAELRDNIASDQNGARDLLFGGRGQDWFLSNSLDITLGGMFGEVVN